MFTPAETIPGSCSTMPAAKSERMPPAADSIASGPPLLRASVRLRMHSTPQLPASVSAGSSRSYTASCKPSKAELMDVMTPCRLSCWVSAICSIAPPAASICAARASHCSPCAASRPLTAARSVLLNSRLMMLSF